MVKPVNNAQNTAKKDLQQEQISSKLEHKKKYISVWHDKIWSDALSNFQDEAASVVAREPKRMSVFKEREGGGRTASWEKATFVGFVEGGIMPGDVAHFL